MPKVSNTDQASARAPREPGTAHLRLMLSGDLESPQQVLAATNLDKARKREVFEVWLRDLLAGPAEGEAHRLVAEIHEAIAMLERTEKEKPGR